MSTHIYDFDYEKELQKDRDNFVSLGSTNPETNIRSSPIVVPTAVKSVTRVSSKRAETPATTTARKAMMKKMPIIIKQGPYDYELNRPYSPVQTNPIATKQDDNNGDDWSSVYDKDFYGGKKRARKARSTRRKRTRSTRRKRTKKSYSRRYRGRKSR